MKEEGPLKYPRFLVGTPEVLDSRTNGKQNQEDYQSLKSRFETANGTETIYFTNFTALLSLKLLRQLMQRYK